MTTHPKLKLSRPVADIIGSALVFAAADRAKALLAAVEAAHDNGDDLGEFALGDLARDLVDITGVMQIAGVTWTAEKVVELVAAAQGGPAFETRVYAHDVLLAIADAKTTVVRPPETAARAAEVVAALRDDMRERHDREADAIDWNNLGIGQPAAPVATVEPLSSPSDLSRVCGAGAAGVV